MKIDSVRVWGALLAATLGMAACGGGGGSGTPAAPASNSPGAQASADYFPLAVGDRWFYSESTGSSNSRVTGTQTVSGATATIVKSLAASGEVSTALYLKDASGVTILPGPAASGLSLALGPLQVLRFPLATGNRWVIADKSMPAVQDVDSDGKADDVTVHLEATVLGFENLDVGTTTLAQVAHVQTVLTETVKLSGNGQTVVISTTADDWFAPNLGPVRSVSVSSSGSKSSRSESNLTAWRVGALRSESIAPSVTSVTPVGGTTVGGFAYSLSVNFSEPMDTDIDPSKVFQLLGSDGQQVRGQAGWSTDGRMATFLVPAGIASGTYSASISVNAQDLLGNPMAGEHRWSFTVDATGPRVTPVTPLADAAEVPLDSKIIFTLDEDPDPASVNFASVQLADLTISSFVEAQVSLSGRTVTLVPKNPLVSGHRYSVQAYYIKDKYGNTSNGNWIFTADPGRFAAPVRLLPEALTVTASAIGDVDGDGRKEILVATGYNSDPAGDFKLNVFRTLPDGSFALVKRYDTVGGYGADIYSLIVTDLDGGGRNAVVLSSSGNAIQIFRQQADGSLASDQIINTSDSYVVVVADINGDGRQDIIGRPFMGSTVSVWLQGADGRFGAARTVALESGGFGSMAVGDLNGDGSADIVTVSSETFSGRQIGIALQQADSSFTAPRYMASPNNESVLGVAIGDVNGDGRKDLVLALNFSHSVGVMLQDARGQLGAASITRGAVNAERVALVDIDGDGRLDVLSSSHGGWGIAINRQRNDGSLGALETYPVNLYGTSSVGLVSVGDVNGDGLVDIVFGSVYLRQRPIPFAPPPAAMKATIGRMTPLGAGH